MNVAALIIYLLLITGLVMPASFLMYMVFILSSFGVLSLMPSAVMGGGNLTPGSAAALFFVLKALSSRPILWGAAKSLFTIRQLGFLGLFLIIAVLGAFVLPHVFEGSVRVYGMRTAGLAPVAPSMANYTQTAYVTFSTLTAAVTAVLMRQPAFAEALPKAILAGGYAIIVAGLMDIVTNAIGMGDVMAYFRTASYVFMTDNFVEGARRVIGLMPEASAYGSVAVHFCAMLLYMAPVFPTRLQRQKALFTGWGCGLMAFLSTSSAAYAMMAVVLFIYAFYRVQRIAPDGNIIKKTVSRKVRGLAMVGGAALLVVLFDSSLAASFMKLINTLIFEKQNSSSYADRSAWTDAGLRGFFESNGLGLGLGSVRTSNFFVNILASTGIVGAILFGLFLWVIFTRRAPESDARAKVIIYAAKLALIPMFVGAALVGTTPDFGVIEGILFGVIAGLGQSRKKAKWVSPLAHKKAVLESGTISA